MLPSALPAWLRDPNRKTLVMGVLNVTPDSFSDGGQFADPTSALARAEVMAGEGADWIDVGAESTRPGSQRVDAEAQLARLRPVLQELRRRVSVVLSVDTTRTPVAEAALDAGIDVVNDISAGRDDPGMFPLVARRNVPIILMHMQGEPATMQISPTYHKVTLEVLEFLQDRLATAESAGISRDQILVDPGIGFGKTSSHNLQLLRDIPILAQVGQPLVVGVSRKRFIGQVTGESQESGRPFGTAAAVAWAAAQGTAVVRVHDVVEMKRVVMMVNAIRLQGAEPIE